MNDVTASLPGPAVEETAPSYRGRPFGPGKSGNPNGRPKGSRNRITRALQEQIDDKAEALMAKAIEKALEGDSSMLRHSVCLRRRPWVQNFLPLCSKRAIAL